MFPGDGGKKILYTAGCDGGGGCDDGVIVKVMVVCVMVVMVRVGMVRWRG